MNTSKLIRLAREHVGDNADNEASARLCLEDAVALYDRGDHDHARQRALKSLQYSVGIFHPAYKAAAAAERSAQ